MMLAVLGKEAFENVIARGVTDRPEHRAEYAKKTAWVESLPPGAIVDIPFLNWRIATRSAGRCDTG